MTLDIFTMPPRYKVTITHPQQSSVTVMSQAAKEHSEERGRLTNGTQLIAELDFRDNGDVWAYIVQCDTNQDTEGYYCALKYSGKTFAKWELWDGTIELAHVKTDFEIRGMSRPTYNNAKGYGKTPFVRGLPMTVPIAGVNSTIMDRAYLEWIISLQPAMPPKELLNNLQGLFRKDTAFNNFQTPKFVISGDTVTILNTIKMTPLMCSGGDVHILGGEVRRWGQRMRPIEIIDTAQNYTRFRPETHPWLFFRPVNSVRVPLFENGTFTGHYDESVVNPFDYFFGLTVLPIHGRGASVGYVRSEFIG